MEILINSSACPVSLTTGLRSWVYGIFDQVPQTGLLPDHISNIWAANVGVTLKPADKMTLNLDAWYAALAENNLAGDGELGLEFDAN